ncbi:MAG: LrgB family protein [Lachnospiraceae bacterium]|nr:LrgB family protein [Lachnospiraceae bacterium]MBQ2405881.1 LrgB family protein [Lachnospiraceae bacterium]MEE0919913.1 LrgB family protein [Lachnospiraceae bacterium]
MNNFFEESLFAGIVLSLISYEIGLLIKKKLKLPIFNPLLISMVIIMLVLVFGKIEYTTYKESANLLNWLLTPATVCLAIPLYEQWNLLKNNYKAVLAGLVAGTVTSLTTVLVLSVICRLSHEEYVTFLPKSITTAIGMGVSQELGGYVTITVAVIVITGVLGNMFGETLCKLFKITEPVSKGLAFGASAHAMGTAKAMEIGEIEGAMSSLAIAVSGLVTVILAPVFSNFIS